MGVMKCSDKLSKNLLWVLNTAILFLIFLDKFFNCTKPKAALISEGSKL
jgi:hypothetical protein